MPPDLPAQAIRLASRRAHLSAQGTTLYRAAHTTETGGLYTLEVAAEVGVLSLYAALDGREEQRLAAVWAETLGLASVYLKRRPQQARHAANVQRDWLSPQRPLLGAEVAELTAREDGVSYLIRPGSDLSIGLFTDARPARRWVREHAHGRVLNTFAYTCGFGLNAALAGAEAVKNLDLSRKVLTWGQQNYALSGVLAPDRDFISGDVFDWLTRLARRPERFDLVVLDPPSFARGKAGVWRSERDYAGLASRAVALLAPGGRVLAMNNHAGVSGSAFAGLVRAGAPELHVTETFGAGEDYPGAAHLKVLVGRVPG
ncbi:class I SAM-dependent rRNA methyltransferase [Deinococcus sp.]|uniref:class I SAM-dependent rRNA methyltransferase n=1 Tax=Deinococcus sp. TaxID=47478 RepID=UPI003C7A487D